MHENIQLFLDFDGVICNSLEECFAASAIALYGLPWDRVGEDLPRLWTVREEAFLAFRPCIREGAEYLLVHELLDEGRGAMDQRRFDDEIRRAGPRKMADFKERLYRVREEALEFHRSWWMARNPLFPGIAEALPQRSHDPDAWIISTKKAAFISEILAYHNVEWPLERILYTGPRRKLDLIKETVGEKKSFLVDDQIDYLDFTDPQVVCRLAAWGFIHPDWLDRPGVRALSLDDFTGILGRGRAS